MSPLVAVGFVAFFVASLTVGIRLVLLWRRTRELPELLIGVGVLGIGPVGFGIMTVAALLGATQPGLASFLFGLAALAVLAGVVSKCVFNWRVYRPTSRFATGIVAAVALFLAFCFLHRLFVTGFTPAPTPGALTLAQSAVQVFSLLWGAGEALRYWTMMRKRMRLGIGDAVVTNRFLLWGIGAGAAGLGTAVGTIAGMILARPTLEIPWVVASSSAHGLVAAIAMSLAFVPPASYLRWIRGNDESVPAPAA